jgi:pyrimidine operon attenuation protein/uracil phosphoribosyltransferase
MNAGVRPEGIARTAATPDVSGFELPPSESGALVLDPATCLADLPDAESLCSRLEEGVSNLLTPQTRLVGIASGGVWLAERLQANLGLEGAAGILSSAMHRDDFAQRGMAASSQSTSLPFEVEGADVILLDDVLYTGRTIRAVLNELFDYGRPASVKLAVLVDRAGRELPVRADFAAAQANFPANEQLALAQDPEGRLSLHVEAVEFKLT